MRPILSFCFGFIIFLNIFVKISGNECLVPENVYRAMFDDRKNPCTSFYLKPGGNYTSLGSILMFDQRPTTESIYSLVEQLKKSAPYLSNFQFSGSTLQGSFDLGRFVGLNKLYQLEVLNSFIDKVIYSPELKDMESVNMLALHGNRLNTFDVSVYKKFPSLTSLHLAGNRFFGVFDMGDLKYQKKPFFFSLEWNKITHLINTAMEDIHVQTLILQSNEIKSIDFKIFRSFPDLTWLRLVNNKISGTFDLANLRHIRKLVTFEIGDEITRIINSVKTEMPTVYTIDLKYNKLTFLDLKDFDTFTNLVNLYLERNKLVSIAGYSNAPAHMPKIKTISIPDNEFYCFQLDDMLAPYNSTWIWYELRETECLGEKNVLFRGVMCCYPYEN